MKYDPQALGAKCHECPCAKYNKVVPTELRPGRPMVISKEPGREEEAATPRRPLVGASGREFMYALRAAGFNRSDVSITNARLCRLPNADQRQADSKRANACCRPRLLAEMEQATAFIALGADGLQAIYGTDTGRGEEGLGRLRGFPLWLSPHGGAHHSEPTAHAGLNVPDNRSPRDEGCKPLVATWQPAFFMRRKGPKRLIKPFRRDIAKAMRHAHNKLTWTEPSFYIDPTRGELETAFNRLIAERKWIACDVETGDGDDAIQPLRAKLRCFGIANESFGVVAGFNSVPREARERIWRCDPKVARELICNFLKVVSELPPGGARLCGHNFNVFDYMVLEANGFWLPPRMRILDTVIGSHIVESELPNNLEWNQSEYTDAPKHKPPHDHNSWPSDYALARYCLADCVTNAAFANPIAREIVASDQMTAYESDVIYQEFGCGMHKAGVFIRESERLRHGVRLDAAKQDALARAQAAAGWSINPGSPVQVREQLFEAKRFGLGHPEKFTESGDPSTDLETLYELMGRTIEDDVAAFLDAVVDYRRASLWKTKYVDRMKPWPEDGRIHPHWHPHIQKVGRISCSDPPLHQLPGTKLDVDSMHSVVGAAPGNVLVYADMAQFHLRLIAVHAGVEKWLRAFRQNLDLHKINAASFFKKRPEDIEGWERDFAKILAYLLVYAGQPPTALANMKKVRDPRTGRRPYAGTSLKQIEVLRNNFLGALPELEAWWARDVAEWRRVGYLASALLRRRSYFRDQSWAVRGDEGSISEIVNYLILALEGDIMGGLGAAGRVMNKIPFNVYGPGAIIHWHDAIVLEVAERRAAFAARELERQMTTEHGGIIIPADAKVGTNLAQLKPWKEALAA